MPPGRAPTPVAQPGGRASIVRSLTKTVSWRALASATTFGLSYAVTGEVAVASSIAGLDLAAKIVLYFGHERLWNLAAWGRT